MISAEENRQLTSVAAGTPMGDLFRRYWHVVASVDEMGRSPTRSVRLLGESLVLFRDARGVLGLVGERCPHRGASLVFGIPDDGGLRCAYHGWRFDASGRCTDMPDNPPGAALRRCIATTAYPVQALGGLVFAYLGPAPAPQLPRWDLFATTGRPKEIASIDVPCNWLQIMENNLDNHARWLHAHFHRFAQRQATSAAGSPQAPAPPRPRGLSGTQIAALGRETDYGFQWQMPFLLPCTVVAGQGRLPCMHIRVPIDDRTTRQFFYTVYELAPETIERLRPHVDEITLRGERVPHFRVPPPAPLDEVPDYGALSSNVMQDVALVTSLGAIYDRSTENLGMPDRGIAFYRKLLKREMAKVQAGADPVGVFRDVVAGERLRLPRMPPFRPGDPRADRALDEGKALDNVQHLSPLMKTLVGLGVDVVRLKFEADA